MGLPSDLGKIIGDAYAEAARRGVDIKRPDCTTAIVEIAMETVSRHLAVEREGKEKERGDRLHWEYRRDPLMHPDNWVGVRWRSGRAFFYRKDLGPPQEVVDALAAGDARIM
jgi:hypothetical protein